MRFTSLYDCWKDCNNSFQKGNEITTCKRRVPINHDTSRKLQMNDNAKIYVSVTTCFANDTEQKYS